MESGKHWMQLALDNAQRGFPSACPNPLVGCVLVKNNRLIASGWHQRFGGPHAEIEALRKAADNASGATLFVNLEPCCFFGKTPPCVDAIKKAGIKEVVAAMKDPDARVRGKGFAVLSKTGIKVSVGLMQKEALALNQPFITQMAKERPYIVLKAAMSLDGKIADFKGDSKWITDSAARQLSYKCRGYFDAIAVGVTTALKDNPSLTAHGQGRNPLRLILDPRLRMNLTLKIMNTNQAPTAIVIAENETHNRKKLEALAQKNVEILTAPLTDDGFQLRKLMKLLSLKGVQSLLVDGGPQTTARFLEANLADEILWFIAPKLLGGDGAKTALAGKGRAIAQAWPCYNLENLYHAGTLIIRACLNPKTPKWSLPPLKR